MSKTNIFLDAEPGQAQSQRNSEQPLVMTGYTGMQSKSVKQTTVQATHATR